MNLLVFTEVLEFAEFCCICESIEVRLGYEDIRVNSINVVSRTSFASHYRQKLLRM